jgi:hypothetical protein
MDPYSAQLLVMNQIGQWSTMFIEHVKMWLVSLGIVILGLVVAEIVRYLVTTLLRLVKFDSRCARRGWTRSWQRFRADLSPTSAVVQFLFWFTWITFFMQALDRLDTVWLAWLGRIYFAYLPLLAEALLISGAAVCLAAFLGRVLRTGFSGHGAGALLAAALVQALLIALGGYYALIVLGVEAGLAQGLILIVFGASALGMVAGWVIHPGRFLRPVIRVEDTEEGG